MKLSDMSGKDIEDVMQRWELTEAKKRRDDPRFEHAQERAEMAIMSGKDYDMEGTNNRKTR